MNAFGRFGGLDWPVMASGNGKREPDSSASPFLFAKQTELALEH